VALTGVAGAQTALPIPAGTTVMTAFATAPWLLAGDAYTTVMTLRLQVRRTAGAGTVSIRPGVFTGGGE
jgi:hypothetical protein